MGDGSNFKAKLTQDGQVILHTNNTNHNNMILNNTKDSETISTDSLSSADFEECVECFPYPGNRKPAGHSGRHRKAPKSLSNTIYQTMDPVQFNDLSYEAALPNEDLVLSPEIPLPGAKPNAENFESLSLDWAHPTQEIKQDASKTEPRTPVPKRKRVHSSVCVISDRKNKVRRKSTTGIGNKRQIKEPQKYKLFTDEQLLVERDACTARVGELKHKHRKGLECPKCIASRDLQIVNRVIQGRAYRAKMDPESVLVKDILKGQKQLKTALDIARPKSSRTTSVLTNQTNFHTSTDKTYNTRKPPARQAPKRTKLPSPERPTPKIAPPVKKPVASTINFPLNIEEPNKPETFTSWTVQTHFRPSEVGSLGLPLPSSASSISSSSTTHSWDKAVQQVEQVEQQDAPEQYVGPLREDFDKDIESAGLVYPIKVGVENAKMNGPPDYGLFCFDDVNDIDLNACTNAQ